MKNIVQEKIVVQAREVLLDCFAHIPGVRVKQDALFAEGNEGRVDFDFILCDRDQNYRILVEVKSSGEPRFARDAANKLLRFRDGCPGTYAIFAAPYISERAAEICIQEGIGYVDLSGNCRLAFGQIFIERTGRPNPFAAKRDFRSLYSPKAERVLRALLVESKRFWQVQELAKESEVSLGQTSNVKRLLRDREWLEIEAGTERFRTANPAALLIEWSQQSRRGKSDPCKYYSLSTASEIEHDLAALCSEENIPYALTGLSAAARYASYARTSRSSAYVTGDIVRLAKRLDWKPVDSGANIILLQPYDDGVFYGGKAIDGISIVSPVQVYLDLAGAQGREREAADFLLEQMIEPTWK